MALIRKSAVACKQQGEASGSTPKVAPKVALKRKNDAKDDHPPKKGTSQSVGISSRNPFPSFTTGLAKV